MEDGQLPIVNYFLSHLKGPPCHPEATRFSAGPRDLLLLLVISTAGTQPFHQVPHGGQQVRQLRE
jgi:hypothetical protein